MNEMRRGSDGNLFKRLWESCTPWMQISGFMLPFVFSAGMYFTQFQGQAKAIDMALVKIEAQELRLNSHDKNYAVINQKLDDLVSTMHQNNQFLEKMVYRSRRGD